VSTLPTPTKETIKEDNEFGYATVVPFASEALATLEPRLQTAVLVHESIGQSPTPNDRLNPQLIAVIRSLTP